MRSRALMVRYGGRFSFHFRILSMVFFLFSAVNGGWWRIRKESVFTQGQSRGLGWSSANSRSQLAFTTSLTQGFIGHFSNHRKPAWTCELLEFKIESPYCETHFQLLLLLLLSQVKCIVGYRAFPSPNLELGFSSYEFFFSFFQIISLKHRHCSHFTLTDPVIISYMRAPRLHQSTALL